MDTRHFYGPYSSACLLVIYWVSLWSLKEAGNVMFNTTANDIYTSNSATEWRKTVFDAVTRRSSVAQKVKGRNVRTQVQLRRYTSATLARTLSCYMNTYYSCSLGKSPWSVFITMLCLRHHKLQTTAWGLAARKVGVATARSATEKAGAVARWSVARDTGLRDTSAA